MSLDTLLKPVQFVDEQILRGYSRIAKKWEDKGRNIYTLSSIFGMPGELLFLFSTDNIFGKTVEQVAYWGAYAWDIPYNFKGITVGIKDSVSDDVAADPFIEVTKKINRTTRLPTLISGVGFAGKAFYDISRYYFTGEPLDNATGNALMLGLGLLGIASSQYLKDRNPKLLEKDSVWKTIYNWTREKINSLVPEPIPQPVPVQAYSTLDSYVQAWLLK